jgi:hypothetical protein
VAAIQRVWKNLVHFFEYSDKPGEKAVGQKTDTPIVLDDHTRATLARWLRRSKTPMGLAKRVQALLLLDQGQPYAATARKVGLSERHIRKWAYRFLEEGLTGLLDRQRPERMPEMSLRARR